MEQLYNFEIMHTKTESKFHWIIGGCVDYKLPSSIWSPWSSLHKSFGYTTKSWKNAYNLSASGPITLFIRASFGQSLLMEWQSFVIVLLSFISAKQNKSLTSLPYAADPHEHWKLLELNSVSIFGVVFVEILILIIN